MTNVTTNTVDQDIVAMIGEDEIVNANSALAGLEEMDELAELLAEETSAPAADLAPEISADLLEAIEEQALQQIEVEEVKAAAYEEQEAVAELKASTAKKSTPTVVGDAAKAKAPKSAATPKTGSTASMKKSEAIVHKLGESRYETFCLTTEMAALDKSALNAKIDELVAEVDVLAKKVGEKVLNMACAVNGKEQLSVYTKIAIDLLKSKGSFTASELRDVYLARPYSAGTASAQGSQMYTLLPFMGIATRSGNTLTLNPESVLANFF